MNCMYSVEQVNIPPEMGTIMKQYTKAVLRDKPNDVYKYSANFFAVLCGKPAPFDAEGNYVEVQAAVVDQEGEYQQNNGQEDAISEQEALSRLFQLSSGDGNISLEELPALLETIRETLHLNQEDLPSAEEVASLLRCEEGRVDLTELRQLLFESEE